MDNISPYITFILNHASIDKDDKNQLQYIQWLVVFGCYENALVKFQARFRQSNEPLLAVLFTELKEKIYGR